MQALIIFIMTIIAVPDSFSWALEPGTKVGDAWISMQNSINERQQRVEKTAAVSTEIVLTSVQERVEFMKESMAGSCGGGDEKKSPLRPFVRLAMVRLDGIGEVVRASPFLVVVLVLDACIAVNDFQLPDMNWVYHFHSFFFSEPPLSSLWATHVTSPPFGRELACDPWSGSSEGDGAACDALGPPNGRCAASVGWAPLMTGFVNDSVGWAPRAVWHETGSNPATPHEGARFEFSHPLFANYIDVHYQLLPVGTRHGAEWWAEAAGANHSDWRWRHNPASFTLRVEVLGNASASRESYELMQAEEDNHVHKVLARLSPARFTSLPVPSSPVTSSSVTSSPVPSSPVTSSPVPSSLARPTILCGLLARHSSACVRVVHLMRTG